MAVMALLSLTACDRTPTDEVLTTDLSAHVERGYAPGLIEVTHAARLDHKIIPDFNRDQRRVAYAARLRLKRDYDFGNWDQANAASLALLLGARPQDLAGLKADGNKAGDTIQATGTLIYDHADGRWRLAAGADVQLESPIILPDRLALLKNWRDLTVMTFHALWEPAAVARSEIVAAEKRVTARLARVNGGIAVASAPIGSNMWQVTQAITGIERATSPAARPLVNVATMDARENLRLLRDGVVSAALIRSTEVLLAAQGQGPFETDGTFPSLRAVASLFPEEIHVVVDRASPIASVADLYGKRIAVAATGPAAMLEAVEILRAHRVVLTNLAAPLVELPVDAALAALHRGEQDAVILTSAAPSAALRGNGSAASVRLLPLDGDAVALLTTGTSNYVAATIPAQTYPGQERSVTTVGLAVMLVSSTAVPADDVQELLGLTFAPRDFMQSGSPFSALAKISTARRGVNLTLHDGAEAFYAGLPGQK